MHQGLTYPTQSEAKQFFLIIIIYTHDITVYIRINIKLNQYKEQSIKSNTYVQKNRTLQI